MSGKNHYARRTTTTGQQRLLIVTVRTTKQNGVGVGSDTDSEDYKQNGVWPGSDIDSEDYKQNGVGVRSDTDSTMEYGPEVTLTVRTTNGMEPDSKTILQRELQKE